MTFLGLIIKFITFDLCLCVCRTELTADEGESGPSRAIDKITGGSANREKNWISDDDLEVCCVY